MLDPEAILESLVGDLPPAGADDLCILCGEAADVVWVGDPICNQCTGRDQDCDDAHLPQRC